MIEFSRDVKRRLVYRTALAALCAVAAIGCGGGPATDRSRGAEVSGRASTGTGITLEFSDGWVEVPGGVTPYTTVFRNKERQLELRCVETGSNGLAVTTHGDQMKRGLSHDGTVLESGPTTVDGRPGYRAVVQIKTPTGNGIVVGTTFLRGDRLSTFYLASAGDERPEHRAEIDRMVASVKVE